MIEPGHVADAFFMDVSAHLLKNDSSISQKVVGLTSAGNVDFVESIECCDQIVTYGDESEIATGLPTARIDMSGDGPLTSTLHHMLGENEAERGRDKGLPGAAPTSFFAPSHMAKRNAEWGQGEIWRRRSEAGAGIARSVSGQFAVEHISGAEDIAQIWRAMLENKVAPSRGIMISM